ncbi:TonB-dependent receptor plug domain-containing protein [Cylindrospermopsis raciborskii]|uniref:Ligand-gated channel n=1 Tax=Cylindrospermopsis raciborskii CENA302 TaxID=1170768 RepID=A0A9Q5WA54_9CYAN|nr:TonB-dependent receptor [Cylindrospermopsis raciborskii]NLQ03633.1 TonB-dependent receptor [Cylindrospermopsis raciborskii MVCC19]OHY31417.1 ligand-gated channel [Cylindrospermopsis raciborskii MVCC14]OPH10362.1 ligand-gated channel [Cylindrospermopsis raciborskii CENA302]
MKSTFVLFPVFLLNLLVVFPAFAGAKAHSLEIYGNRPIAIASEFSPTSTSLPAEQDDSDISVDVIGEKDVLPESTPTYIIDKEEIQKQGATNVADVLKTMPGFTINNVGHGADIHTGTYYRGASIDQSVFLINGRPINTNISTYHGATDLNSIPVESIERIELYSGGAASLYGSSAFGGVVNIITKEGSSKPKLTGNVEFGSLNFNNQQLSYSGSGDRVKYNFSFERFFIDNHYPVPEGAANRNPADGFLFNADTGVSTYFGRVGLDLDPKNSLNFDVKTISSRRGLVYFGFPLQRDRLDHDAVNVGVSWKTKLGQDNDSNLTTTIGYNQDYFSTYGPTGAGGIFNRTGILDTKQITARVDHEWKLSPNNQLRWGLDLKGTNLKGDVISTNPALAAKNEKEDRRVLNTALFGVNTWRITNDFSVDLGLRQNIDSKFGSYLNPSVGLKYAINPVVAVRGSWGGAQRNPGLDQLYVFDTVHNWDPNPDLKPETGSTWTAGFDFNISSNLSAQLTYFGSSLDNRLSLAPRPAPNPPQWDNVGLVSTNGLEGVLQYRFAPNWSSFVNYTYTDAQIKTGTEKGRQLGLIPYSLLQSGVGYENKGWAANLYLTYNSGTRRALFTNTNAGQQATDFAPSFVNLDLSGRIPMGKNVGLTFYLENLLGEQYEKVNRIYSPGFTFRVGVNASI